MVVGILKVSLSLCGARSLKDKRQTLRSVKDRVKNRFNVSIAEVGDHDWRQGAVLGVCVVAADKPHADSQLQKTLDLISQQAVVSEVSMEFINL